MRAELRQTENGMEQKQIPYNFTRKTKTSRVLPESKKKAEWPEFPSLLGKPKNKFYRDPSKLKPRSKQSKWKRSKSSLHRTHITISYKTIQINIFNLHFSSNIKGPLQRGKNSISKHKIASISKIILPRSDTFESTQLLKLISPQLNAFNISPSKLKQIMFDRLPNWLTFQMIPEIIDINFVGRPKLINQKNNFREINDILKVMKCKLQEYSTLQRHYIDSSPDSGPSQKKKYLYLESKNYNSQRNSASSLRDSQSSFLTSKRRISQLSMNTRRSRDLQNLSSISLQNLLWIKDSYLSQWVEELLFKKSVQMQFREKNQLISDMRRLIKERKNLDGYLSEKGANLSETRIAFFKRLCELSRQNLNKEIGSRGNFDVQLDDQMLILELFVKFSKRCNPFYRQRSHKRVIFRSGDPRSLVSSENFAIVMKRSSDIVCFSGKNEFDCKRGSQAIFLAISMFIWHMKQYHISYFESHSTSNVLFDMLNSIDFYQSL